MKKLSKLFSVIIITLASLILVVLLGCSMVQDAFTPTWVNPDAAVAADEPLTSFLPLTTLFDAQRILRKLQYIQSQKMLEYDYLTNGLHMSIQAGREFQANVFDPTGPLGLLLVGGPALTLGAFGFSKPSDKKKIMELQNGSKKKEV